MGRYVIITNIWGKKPQDYNKFVWKVKDSKNYPDYFEKEKHEFDNLDELKGYISLFEEYCSSFHLPPCIKNNIKGNKHFEQWNEGDRLWGYIWGDRNTRQLWWGGYKLKEYNASTDKKILLDMLFRLPTDIPEKYVWDDGEYEGWLQFKWGDGKNAIDYVDKHKKSVNVINKEIFDEDDMFIDEYENIEDEFDKIENKEKIKLLEDRW